MEDQLKQSPELKESSYLKLTLWHSRTFTPICTHAKLEPIMASIGFFPYIPHSTSTADSLKKKMESQSGMRSAARKNGSVSTALEQNLQKDKTTSAGGEPVEWREYVFGRTSEIPSWGLNLESTTRPRLPYPRVDGLHLRFYMVFFAALECYINPYVVANLFHVRPIPVKGSDKKYYKELTRMSNFATDPEIEGVKHFVCRGDNLDDHTFMAMYSRLKASVDDLSQNETVKKYVRKDEMRKIEEDERDDSSDFVCLIDNVDALYGIEKGQRLKRVKPPSCAITGDVRADDQGIGEVGCNFTFVSLSSLIQTADNGNDTHGARVPQRKRSVRKKMRR